MRWAMFLLAVVILVVGAWRWYDSPEIVPGCPPDPIQWI